MTKDEALDLALKALTVLLDEWTPARQAQLKGMEAITAIKQALADIKQDLTTVQEPAFHGFMDKENCCVNLCYTPWAPRMTDGKLATAYYTTPCKECLCAKKN